MVSPMWSRRSFVAPLNTGMVTMPGVLTPTEAITCAQGRSNRPWKFFPANLLGPAVIRSIAAVLPPDQSRSEQSAVVSEKDFPAYAGRRKSGPSASVRALYRPGGRRGRGSSQGAAARSSPPIFGPPFPPNRGDLNTPAN